jgi:hypothetical protein
MGNARSVLGKLNTTWHENALLGFLAVVIAHLSEHAVQAVQIFVLGWPRPDSRGILGEWFPWLVTSETLHYLYAVLTLAGLALLLPAFAGRARFFWQLALVFQFWHHFEHVLLLSQKIVGHPFFGQGVPTSVLQLYFPRVELHLFYNGIVFVPMVIAIILHMYPPRWENERRACGCAKIPAPAGVRGTGTLKGLAR